MQTTNQNIISLYIANLLYQYLNNLFNDSSNFVNNKILEKTEVVYGIENIIARAIERWKNTEKKMDSCIDRLQPKLLVTDNVMFSELVKLVRKDIRTRIIFEITEENVYYIKELMELIRPYGKKHVIRHLDNVIGNFSIYNALNIENKIKYLV